jgi:hypothetical protein
MVGNLSGIEDEGDGRRIVLRQEREAVPVDINFTPDLGGSQVYTIEFSPQ